MIHCAILDDYQGVALELADWSSLAPKVTFRVYQQPFSDAQSLVAAVGDCAIICLMRERTPFTRPVMESLPELRLLLTSGMRNASIDMEAAQQRGITVCGTESSGHPAAELALGIMLELARRIGYHSGELHGGGPWLPTLGCQLEGRTLSLLGLGKLGQRMAEFGKALGMRAIAWSENLSQVRCQELGVEWVPAYNLFQQADFLSVHLQLSERTEGLVGTDLLSQMKPTAFLINTSRGPIVEQGALLAALQEGRLAGAGLDVFDEEPLPVDHPFRGLENVVLTPHLGYSTRENISVYYAGMVEDISAWLSGQPVRVLP